MKLIISLFFATLIKITYAHMIYLVPPNGYEYERVFNLRDPILNRDNCIKHFVDLKLAFLKLGYLLHTATYQYNLKRAEFFLGSEIPDDKIALKKIAQFPRKKATIIWEPPTVIPSSYILKNHKYYDAIFTWDDSLVDNKKYRKIFYSMPDTKPVELIPFSEKKLCVLMGNFGVLATYPNELYSERRKIVEYFNEYHPNDFDLYNRGNYCNQYHVFRGGALSPKKETLKKYKFCICYENTKDAIGYISEKIFDCFLGMCVPVYWGAANITDFVPQECFIDRNQFKSHDELYTFLNTMDETTYNNYIEAIKKYLHSDAFGFFSPEYFVHTIVTFYLPHYPKDQLFSPEVIKRHRHLDKLYEKLSHKWSTHV